MPKLKFLGTFIRYYDGRIDTDDLVAIRVHLTSALTSSLAEQLGCKDALAFDSVTAAPVRLATSDILITDAQLLVENLENNMLEVAGQKLCDFYAIRREEDGAVTREIRFQMILNGSFAPLVNEYLMKIGKTPGLLTVSTQEQETQQELPAG